MLQDVFEISHYKFRNEYGCGHHDDGRDHGDDHGRGHGDGDDDGVDDGDGSHHDDGDDDVDGGDDGDGGEDGYQYDRDDLCGIVMCYEPLHHY